MYYQLFFITGSAVNASIPTDVGNMYAADKNAINTTFWSGFTLGRRVEHIDINGNFCGLVFKNTNDISGYLAYTPVQLNIPALNFTYGSSNTVQPSSIQSLIIIKDWIAEGCTVFTKVKIELPYWAENVTLTCPFPEVPGISK